MNFTRIQTSRRLQRLVQWLLLAAGCLPVIFAFPFMQDLPPVPEDAVTMAVKPKLQYFDLADVTLGDGPFRDAMLLNKTVLLRLDPDRFLHTFRLNVGLPSFADPYGGWEAPDVELRGHSLGHYLTACALMYRSDRDPEIKGRIDYIVRELALCQEASPSAGFNAGYLSAFPESFFDRLEARNEWVWAPYYTMHKIFQGLIDAYRLAGSKQAFDVVVQMADWLKGRVDNLDHEQMQAVLEIEYGGMNEALANLYATTGNPEHLRLFRVFDQESFLNPLSEGRDTLEGLHANTQIPKVIGAAREYEITGLDYYGNIARFFWDRVAQHHSYVIGGNSDREHFFDLNEFYKHLSPETAETCNTYNMLRLTRKLFSQNPDPDYMEFYERGLYNHILASQDPARGMFVYFMSLKPGHYKAYSTLFNSFWCCMGTGMENHGKYGDTIFAHTEDTLYVNLFVSALVDWKEKGIQLRQRSNILEGNTTRFELSCQKPAELSIKLRHPSWAKGGLTVSLNGENLELETDPGSWFSLSRVWQSGDIVEIHFPMELSSEVLPAPANNEIINPTEIPVYVALKYGPLVLAGLLGNDGMPNPYTAQSLYPARIPDPVTPVFVAEGESLLENIRMVSRNPLVFRTDGLAMPEAVTLIPLYKVNHERYSVYWRVMRGEEWPAYSRSAEETAQEIDQFEKQAVDRIVAGNMVSEVAHRLRESRTQSGTISSRSWRHAYQPGGYFEYEFETQNRSDLQLICVFGAQNDYRPFDITVEDEIIATPTLAALHDTASLIRWQAFQIPVHLLQNRDRIRLRIQAPDAWDAATADVFECMLVPVE